MDSIKLAVWRWRPAPLEELTAELEPLWRERGDLWLLQWTLLESAFVPIGAARWEEAEQRLADALAIKPRSRPARRSLDARRAVLAEPKPRRVTRRRYQQASGP